jgi:4-oxalocrotonate tautomerase
MLANGLRTVPAWINLFDARSRVAARADHTGAAQTNDWRTPMPLLNVRLIEGVFTPAQKQEMIRKLTDTMVSIEGENMRAATVVIIDEVKSGDWGFGGKPYTTSDVLALAAGKSKG